MTRGLVLVTFIVMMLIVTETSGQPAPSVVHPGTNPGVYDRLPVPLEQMADVIVVLIPDDDFDLHAAAPYERILRGSIVRLDKGPMPQMIVHTPNTFTNPLKAGVPAKLFLTKFKDRDAYYIIGVIPAPAGEKP